MRRPASVFEMKGGAALAMAIREMIKNNVTAAFAIKKKGTPIYNPNFEAMGQCLALYLDSAWP